VKRRITILQPASCRRPFQPFSLTIWRYFFIIKKQAYKPDSVFLTTGQAKLLKILIIYLMLPTLWDRASSAQASVYMALQPARFTLPLLLPKTRCALTAPFHPYLYKHSLWGRYIFCGTFCLRLTQILPFQEARCSMLSGLSSPINWSDKAACFAAKVRTNYSNSTSVAPFP